MLQSRPASGHSPGFGGRGGGGGDGRGFTLVELLVVIGIIALLIAILLPTLRQAKIKAQGAACASQSRQIYLAMALFAQDNKGRLPRPFGVGELSSQPQHVLVNAYLQKVANATGHIDYDDGKGALWKYVKGRDTRQNLLMCPGDSGEPLAGHPVNAAYPRNFSYSMNHLVRRDVNGVPSLGLVLTKVRQPAQRILIYEELAPNDAWCIMGLNTDDVPSGRHGKDMKAEYRINPSNNPYYRSTGRGMHAFFDGHVESLAPGDLLPHPTDPNISRRNAQYHFPLVPGDRTTF